MKPLTIAAAVAVFALPLCASDDQQPKQTTTVPSTTLSAPPAQNQDSPLVRAAKSSGRLGKKPSMVITNDTLLKSGGHMTTTNNKNTSTGITPLNAAQQPTPGNSTDLDRYEAQRRAKQEADAKAKQATEKAGKDAKLRQAAAELNGEAIEERVEDPAMQEHVMEQMTSTQPKVQPSQKPPM